MADAQPVGAQVGALDGAAGHDLAAGGLDVLGELPRDVRETLAWAGTYRMARKWWRTGLSELRHAVSARALVKDGARYIPGLTPDDVLPGPAGVRAQALGRDGSLVDDFVVSETERALHVRNAPSPAATSSLALARLIADRVP